MLTYIQYFIFFLFASRVAAFNLYPSVNSDTLAKSFGTSVDCLDALNETVTCDQTLFQMSNMVDSYLWTTDNVTDLCTTDCVQSTQKWWSDVQDRCATDTIAAYGKMIPAETIAGRFSNGLNIACLRSGSSSTTQEPSKNGSSSSSGSAPYSNISSSSTGPGPYSNSSSNSSSNSRNLSWCLIESQDWVGSDIIRPDCSTDSTDPSCSDPTNVAPQNERIANLYDNTMLCSECFLKMFYQRMSSPYLSDSDYSDYLVVQYQDILDVCKASMPELVVRALPYYQDAPGMYDGMPLSSLSSDSPLMPSFSSNGTQFSNGTNSTTTCSGQTIRAANLQGVNISANGTGCNTLSIKYSVTTGDLQTAIGDAYCVFSASSYCVPAACSLMKVPSGASCDSIVSSLSTSGSNTGPITTVQFMNWNPNNNGLCDNLNEGDYVCTSAPGGSYVPPPVSNTLLNASALQREGGDESDAGASSNIAPFSNSTLPTNTTALPSSNSSSSGPAAPSPTQKGISASCTKYSQAKKGDSCSTFAQENNITPLQLYSLNTALGNTGKNCDTAFWSGYYYCVGSNAVPAAISSNPTTTTTALPAIDPTSTAAATATTSDPAPTSASGGDSASPSPTQSGIASPCAKYAQAHVGDTCTSFAAANEITPADLYARNGALGNNGEECGMKFWGGYYYCVGGTD